RRDPGAHLAGPDHAVLRRRRRPPVRGPGPHRARARQDAQRRAGAADGVVRRRLARAPTGHPPSAGSRRPFAAAHAGPSAAAHGTGPVSETGYRPRSATAMAVSDTGGAVALYRTMYLLRRFEAEAEAAHRRQEMPLPYVGSAGEEAVAA